MSVVWKGVRLPLCLSSGAEFRLYRPGRMAPAPIVAKYFGKSWAADITDTYLRCVSDITLTLMHKDKKAVRL